MEYSRANYMVVKADIYTLPVAVIWASGATLASLVSDDKESQAL